MYLGPLIVTHATGTQRLPVHVVGQVNDLRIEAPAIGPSGAEIILRALRKCFEAAWRVWYGNVSTARVNRLNARDIISVQRLPLKFSEGSANAIDGHFGALFARGKQFGGFRDWRRKGRRQ